VLDDGVAFAGDVFERRAVDDVDEPPAVADQAGAVQEASRDGHRGAPHAEHLSEKLLRQRDDIAVDAVVRLQQPTAKSGLEAMQRIARNRLLDLREQDIVVAHDELAEGRALGGSRDGATRCSGAVPYGISVDLLMRPTRAAVTINASFAIGTTRQLAALHQFSRYWRYSGHVAGVASVQMPCAHSACYEEHLSAGTLVPLDARPRR
jgi:hypothetical protein